MPSSLGLVTHVWNEEVLLPHWIRHHLPLADDCIIIDHGSTDSTLDICKELAPHWRVVPTKLPAFDAHLLDAEVQETELLLSTEWKMALNVTEFLFHSTLRTLMEEFKDYDAIGFKAYMMVDKVLDLPLDAPLWQNRTFGYMDDGSAMNSRRGRYMHSHDHGHYNLGRHGTSFPRHIESDDWNILFASFSPWPQAIKRKLQIQERIPLSDKQNGFGIQHLQNTQTLNNFYLQELAKSSDLLLDSNFKMNYDYFVDQWRETYGIV